MIFKPTSCNFVKHIAFNEGGNISDPNIRLEIQRPQMETKQISSNGKVHLSNTSLFLLLSQTTTQMH